MSWKMPTVASESAHGAAIEWHEREVSPTQCLFHETDGYALNQLFPVIE
jgi:hypothetical protein